MGQFRLIFKKWALRYIKYNVIGLSVFMLNIVIYVIIFPALGEWSYILVSVNGGIVEFALIAYFNKTKRGIIFESCMAVESNLTGVSIQTKSSNPPATNIYPLFSDVTIN